MSSTPEELSHLGYALSAREYFLHIKAQEPDEAVHVPQRVREVDELLAPFEECFLADAGYYSNRPELLMKFDREGLPFSKERPINHFQLKTSQDMYSFWGVEMRLDKSKVKNLWIPRTTAFIRIVLNDMNLSRLRSDWINADDFLHPYVTNASASYRDPDQLQDRILSRVLIRADEQGKINYISRQTRDTAAQGNLFQRASLVRRSYPEARADQLSSSTLTVLKEMLSDLPVESIEYGRNLRS